MNRTCDICQVGEIEDNRCWWCGEEQKQEVKINAVNYQPLVLGFWVSDPEINRPMMMMAQVFKDPNPRRTWKGYRIHFYADEFKPIGSKPLNWLHIHFIGQTGEVRIVPQWGNVPNHIQTLMRKFVQNNYQDIMEKIKQDFRNLGIEPKI